MEVRKRMEIKTERLIIRKLEMTDDFSVLQAMECPEVHLMYSNGFTDIEKVRSYINVILNEYTQEKYRTLAIADKATSILIGMITLDITPMFSRVEYSYWISKENRNKGYATETLKAMHEYCFDCLKLNRIQAMTSNPVSAKVIEKSGMIYEGTLRQYYGMGGEYWDVKVYSIVRSDYTSSESVVC